MAKDKKKAGAGDEAKTKALEKEKAEAEAKAKLAAQEKERAEAEAKELREAEEKAKAEELDRQKAEEKAALKKAGSDRVDLIAIEPILHDKEYVAPGGSFHVTPKQAIGLLARKRARKA